LDRHSDLFEENFGDICKNCMILALRYDVTDKTGKKLLPKDEIYTHHSVIGTNASGKPMNPVSVNRTCLGGGFGGPPAGGPQAGPFGVPKGSGGPSGGFPKGPGGLPGVIPEAKGPGGPSAAAPKGPPPGGPGGFPQFPNFGNLGGFFASPPTILINKGQEKNTINFDSLDPKEPRSGFWIGNNETIMTSIEIVNYKTTTQDIYVTLDLEYLNFDSRPKNYLKTEFASLTGFGCSPGAGMRRSFTKPQKYGVTYGNKVLRLTSWLPTKHQCTMSRKVFI
jgi:hypothetical protein